jgi:tRNA dimethylallyltransferase
LKTCIIIAGPTAAGKTGIAIRLAKYFGTSIISSDSRQCYKEMTIGVAKPDEQDLAEVPHFFINTHSIQEEVSAGIFERYALDKAEQIFEERNELVMAGGTGLYIKAFCEGIDQIPDVPAALRKQLNSLYESEGMEWLQQELKQKDPLYYSTGEIANPHRMLRALEVKLASGRSIREFQTSKKADRDFDVIKIGIGLEREDLYRNINTRVDRMMEQGLLEEIKGLYDFRRLKALQTVGYTELFDFLDGKYSEEEAVEEIKKNTRHYAKRQMTWFRKDPGIKWFNAVDYTGILEYLLVELQKRTGYT